ncbi:MAG: hypothetical protein ABFS37_10620 [Acidobacteriota bacterium]
MTAWSNRAAWAALVLVCAAFVGHGLFHLFVQDDAYIFFRYSENWINGWGPVWNQGERVEGYTSPAWLAILTTIRLATGSFEPGIHIISLGLGVGALVLLFMLAGSVVRDPWAGLAAALLMASDRTFALWSTSGMETRLFGFLVLGAALLVWRRYNEQVSRAEDFALGPTLLLLCLTRPEGFLFAGLMLLFLLVARATALRSRWGLWGLALWATGVAGHLWWRWSYYGDLLPNTFYAKVPGFDFRSGATYMADFAASFPVFSLAAILAVSFHLGRALITRTPTFGAALSAVIVIYSGYVTAIGGGFMEFRMLDAVMAPASILIVSAMWSLFRKFTPRTASASALGVVIAAATVGLNAGMYFEDQPHSVMTRSEMWKDSTRAWVLIGKFFGRTALPGESLATTAAGAIPYFSKMRCLDQLGLNDHFIAHSPVPEGSGVGHRKRAPETYLARRKITYVIGHPRLYLRPKVEYLQPGEFFMRIEDPSGIIFFLAVRTMANREPLIASLRERGVVVVDPGTPEESRDRNSVS